jgi:DNA-binding beta-propeller fold protein YncE
MKRIWIRDLALALTAIALTNCVCLAQPTGVVTSNRNPLQIALKHWYAANSTTSFTVGTDPTGIAFDGANIWVTNFADATVSKLRANDGALLGTFAVGSKPYNAAFDGANIWVTNQGDNNVTKLRASDGAVLGTFAVGSPPMALRLMAPTSG